MTFWPRVIRTVDNIEAVPGIALNLAVLYFLWSRKYKTNMLAYRISITIIAIQGLIISLILAALSNTVHLIEANTCLIVVYGWIVSISETVGYFLVHFSMYPILCMVQLIPGSCLLQYLVLSKPHITTVKKLILAYGVCSLMLLWSTPYCMSIHASPSFDRIVRAVHGSDDSDHFVTKGFFLMPTPDHPRAMINLTTECIIPSYAISFAIYGITVIKCRRILACSVKLSVKTLKLHQRFMIMLALQNLLPLGVLGIPIGIMAVGVLCGFPLGLIALIMSFCGWTIPIVQGSVALLFVLRIRKTSVGYGAS